MIKFDRDEFLRPQIYSTKEEYQTRYKASNEIIKDIKELQERIDEAIGLIKQYDNTFIEMNLAIKLREILKGEKE